MNDLTDSLDAPPKLNPGEVGRTFTFRGIDLQPMSWLHSFSFWRTVDSPLKFERAILLLYMLTLDGARVSAIRSDADKEAARIASVKWAEGIGIDSAFVDEAIAKAAEIEEDQAQATSVQPKVKPGPNA